MFSRTRRIRMIEIRMHGRGGQGAVIAAKILASAIFKEGKYAQSFPSFGVERRGLLYSRLQELTTNLSG